MQLINQNNFPPLKNAQRADYTIKKRPAPPLGNPSNLEKRDPLLKSQKDSVSLNEKRPFPQKTYDPFGDLNNEADGIQEKRVVKKVKPSSDSFLTSNLPLDIKQPPPMNETPSLKKLLQSSEPEQASEKRVNPLIPGISGYQKSNESEIVIKTKKPNPPPVQVVNSHPTTPTWGNTLVEGNFLSNKLKYLPHVKSKESKYSNSIVPVLPSFLTEDF